MKTLLYLLQCIVLISCGCGFSVAQAQSTTTPAMEGRIVDALTNEPLAFASIYYNNSTIGTQSDQNGNFSLPFLGADYQVIVSYVGYETAKHTLTSGDDRKRWLFKLGPVVKTIKEVAISAPRSEMWYKNMEMFTKQVIGNGSFSKECELLNPEVLQFYYDTTTLVMRAQARDVIKIKNSGLGYEIHYTLEEYSFNVVSREFVISGYPYFIPLQGTRSQLSRWAFNRQVVYEGSLQHFLRTLHQDSLANASFEVQRVRRVAKPDSGDEAKIVAAKNALKQLPYYQAVDQNNPHQRLLVRAEQDRLVEKIEPGELGFRDYSRREGDQVWLQFQDYLKVSYEKPNPYRPSDKVRTSSYVRLQGPAVKTDATGRLLEPELVLLEGYWAEQLLGDLLPFDFVWSKSKKGWSVK